MITVFTPTYNRASLLKRLYASLVNQTDPDFEWVVVDDGSTDDTYTLIQDFINEQKIPIIFYKQANQGKHFAINKGVTLASKPYFFIVDSDDALIEDSISRVKKIINESRNLPNIGGVSGIMIDPNFKPISSTGFEPIFATSIDIRNQHKIKGDLAEVFKTAVLQEFPFPEIENEKFCPEVLVWNRIAKKYKIYYTDVPLYVAEYQSDGLSSKIVTIRMTSPVATMLTYSELASSAIPLLQKIKATINYWRFSFHSTQQFRTKWAAVSPLISIFAIPIGYLMYKKDLSTREKL